MASASLLVELFVEELPPKSLQKLGQAFATGIADSLAAQGLTSPASTTTVFASPRRLAVHLTDVAAAAADTARSQKLMPVAVGLDAAGQPTPALLKKLAAVGADAGVVPQLERRLDGKTEALFLDRRVAGATLADGLQRALDDALARLPTQKSMTYPLADGWTTTRFVRPAHGLVALHGSEVVPVGVLGLESGRETRGHRFEASIDPIRLVDADAYAGQLEREGAVIASFAARRAEIARQLQVAADAEGLVPIDDPALLDEVTALVERPNVLVCRFDADFLGVPPECLILTMKANQKYFPLLDAAGKLTERFLVVSNIRPADPSRVIEGNERVVRPRLADARFFFEQDRKKTLASRADGLDQVVYHGKLGTLGDRVLRVRAIARAVGAVIGSARAGQLAGEALAAEADRAALLAKADLLTDMVGEFPELQGVMGGYYARHDGETDAIAEAIEDHYRPRFAGDALPRGELGLVVALADKVETLVGLFGIGQLPTGDKDPFALRRHALGVVRMLVERRLPIDLDALLHAGTEAFLDSRLESHAGGSGFSTRASESIAALKEFMLERLAVNLREQGFGAREVDAVLSLAPARLADVADRLAAVRAFAALPEAAALAAANKRVGNILAKAGAVTAAVDPARFAEPAEAALHEFIGRVGSQADAAFERGDYAASLQALAAMREPVDAFFDAVMVNVDDAALRANRLALLARLHAAMNRVADLSKL